MLTEVSYLQGLMSTHLLWLIPCGVQTVVIPTLGVCQPLPFLSHSEILVNKKTTGKMCEGDMINTFCRESLVVIPNQWAFCLPCFHYLSSRINLEKAWGVGFTKRLGF